jgi:hypothetical protein
LQTTATGPTAGARPQPCKDEENKGVGFQPCKVQEQVKMQVEDFNLAKLKQTIENSKNKTSEEELRGPTAVVGPQLCKVEANNNKKHLANQQTIEQATTNEPIMSLDNNIGQIHYIQDCIQKFEENVL